MAATTGADVASLLDRSSEAAFVAVCNQAVSIARALCSAYTRGRGFTDGTGTAADIGRPAAGKTGTTETFRSSAFLA